MAVEPTIDESRFKVEFLQPEDFEEVHNLQVDCFTEQNAETKGCGITKWAWGEFSRWLNGGWEKVGLTQIVRDRQAGGAIVSFLFCKELNSHEPFVSNWDDICKDSPGFRRLVEHGGHYVGKARAVPRIGPTLAIETGGTKPGYEGLGIAKYLRWRLCQLAPKHGYLRMAVETSSMATRHIYQSLCGFEIMQQSRYVEWQAPDGTYPFRDEYPMPDDFLFTCQHKVFTPDLGSLRTQRLVVSGAAADAVNGTYVQVPGSRGTWGWPHATFDAWAHLDRPGTFISNADGHSVGKPEWGRRWMLLWPKGICYSKVVSDADKDVESPPEGEWETAPWAVAHGHQPGEGPPPKIELCLQAHLHAHAGA